MLIKCRILFGTPGICCGDLAQWTSKSDQFWVSFSFFGPVGSLVMVFSGAGCTGFSLGLFGRVLAFLTFCLWCSLCGMWACFSAMFIFLLPKLKLLMYLTSNFYEDGLCHTCIRGQKVHQTFDG